MKAAVYAGTRNLYGEISTSAKSLVANSDVTDIFVLAEDATIGDVPEMVHVIDMEGQSWFDLNGPNVKPRYTYMALLRAALCHILTDLDVVLSLDCDTVAVYDCSHVWDIPLDGCYFAATQERWAKIRPGLQYCNTGVALMNLRQLRDGKADEIISVLNTHYLRWPEQDALNYLCQGRIAEMPAEFNVNPWTVDAFAPETIVHYAALNDWKTEKYLSLKKYADYYAGMSWQEAMQRHAEKVR